MTCTYTMSLQNLKETTRKNKSKHGYKHVRDEINALILHGHEVIFLYSTQVSMKFIMFINEPRHVISNNVAF